MQRFFEKHTILKFASKNLKQKIPMMNGEKKSRSSNINAIPVTLSTTPVNSHR
jgi:hypothetical protein